MSGGHSTVCTSHLKHLIRAFANIAAIPGTGLAIVAVPLLTVVPQCEDVVTPEAVLPLDEDQMRGVGLSYAKVSVLHPYVLVFAASCQPTWSTRNCSCSQGMASRWEADMHMCYSQARYILDLAKHFQSGQLSDEKIATMDDDTLVEELTKVKGIGECCPCRA